MSYFLVSSLDPTPLGTRISAGTRNTKLGSQLSQKLDVIHYVEIHFLPVNIVIFLVFSINFQGSIDKPWMSAIIDPNKPNQ